MILRDEEDVIASAKSRSTTRHDLAEGIGKAAAATLQSAGIDAGDIAMASLSTTLATNALVEGQGPRWPDFYRVSRGRFGQTWPDPSIGGRSRFVDCRGPNHAGGEAVLLDLAAIDRMG